MIEGFSKEAFIVGDKVKSIDGTVWKVNNVNWACVFICNNGKEDLKVKKIFNNFLKIGDGCFNNESYVVKEVICQAPSYELVNDGDICSNIPHFFIEKI